MGPNASLCGVWQADVYYLVRESLPGVDAYHAVIEEVRLSGDGENVSLHSLH